MKPSPQVIRWVVAAVAALALHHELLAQVAVLSAGAGPKEAGAQAAPGARGHATGLASQGADRAPGHATDLASQGADRAPGISWIKQKPKAEIGALRLTLADVADVDALDPTAATRLRAVDLGEIPGKGRQLVLTRDTLRDAVAAAKLGGEVSWAGADATHVDLKLFTLSGDEIAALGRRHVAKALGESGAQATFGPSAPPRPLACVAGRWSTRVFVRNAPSERFSGAIRLEAVAVADGIERASVPFVVEVERKGRVYVAARDLAQGAALKTDDLTPVERNLAAVGSDAIEQPERVVGLVLARRVQAGQVVTARDFRLPAVIERDDVVQIRFRAGALKVTGLGRAQAAGAPGDRIAVVNLGSGKTLHAVVVDSRTVEIATGFTDS